MKKILVTALAALSLTPQVSANSALAIGAGITQQDLFGTIEFSMPTLHLNYNYWFTPYLGIYADIGRTTETANSLYIEGKEYTNKIYFMSSVGIAANYPISESFGILASVGQTDYKSTWRVNGIKPSWHKGVDSDKSYHIGLTYNLDSDYYLALVGSKLYSKEKKGFGKETTDSIVLYLGYKF